MGVHMLKLSRRRCWEVRVEYGWYNFVNAAWPLSMDVQKRKKPRTTPLNLRNLAKT